MQPIFDAKWRAEALAGDESAVVALAEAALTPLYRFCLYRLGQDVDLCEDAVQETLVKAIAQLDGYDPDRCGNNIFPWLTGLARNEIRRALSQHKSAAQLESLWLRMDRDLLDALGRVEQEPFADEVLEREETREMVNTAMSQLPPHYGQALEAKYLQGKSVRELASLWRMSEKAAESLLTRAREAFRATFLTLAKNLNCES